MGPCWCYGPSGHPAYNEGTGNILLPMESGDLYALNSDLGFVWRWPGHAPPGETDVYWGTPCAADNSIFIPAVDTIVRGNDTIPGVTKFYEMPDGPDRPTNPPYMALGTERVLGAPVALKKD